MSVSKFGNVLGVITFGDRPYSEGLLVIDDMAVR